MLTLASRADYRFCKQIQQERGANYFVATRFFPRDMRLGTWALYAFFRLPDDIVDVANVSQEEASQRLQQFKADWEQAIKTKTSDSPVLRAALDTHLHFQIPFSYSHDFFAAMEQDTVKDRYKDYEELREYMYGSAAVVGLMMSYLIGFSSERALPYAEDLGYAMQLTNFLRDLREDIEERNRIYIPGVDLYAFAVSEADLAAGRITPAFRELMKFEITRARALYRRSEQGIPMLRRRGQFAVRAALRLYEAILDEIEARDYDVFSERILFSTGKKLRIAVGL
ncbi:MAG: phytoene/squalene synthase family protein [bacterium]|nr:phytoene/squalene synthase family protein [bacterium]MDA1024341.1 phytoene/squalene synthase family protein [bacterium]